MTDLFHFRFNISNTVYKTWFTLRKFNFELKLRKHSKEKFDAGNWKKGNLISGAGREDWNKTVMGRKKFEN